ncbi:polysaccharide biosynthesis/export family protein [Aestuariibacter sp. A3R04]|uniref:polysaccharide biosynthesis/export family protein n=1 Tax=Aestuariibacter sp. A3R04 TaxID=2841571 RepID=UPI001C08EA5F|nr:polysaccharide biosynthesis/export family protein [Aestuariibacter sp. A3R04]MBU3023744.1 polysaccharide export protein [Aestuariibacter sp. A3R04]
MPAKHSVLTKQLWFLIAFTTLFFTVFSASTVSAQDLTQYRLSADDVISVTVFNEPDLSLKEARVSSSGTIAMPLIGQVAVRGLTLTDVEQEIHRMYLGDYLKKPDISVSIVEYRQFYVNGEVDKPGGFSYREGMTVERAITLAGGFTGRAAKNKIFIVREDAEGAPISAKLTTLIRPGDVITVEESFF